MVKAPPSPRAVAIASGALAALAAGIVATAGTQLDGLSAAAAAGLAMAAVAGAVAWIVQRHAEACSRHHAGAAADFADRLESLGARARLVTPPERPPRDPLALMDAAEIGVTQLRELAQGVHGLEAIFGLDGHLMWISPSIERLTGWSPEACLAAPDAITLLVHESDRGYCQRMAKRVAEGSEGEDFEMRLLREDGRICWVACHWRPLRAMSSAPAGLRMSAEDIQARKETEYKLLETVTELRRAQALRERYLARSNDERQRLSALLNVIRLGILFMDRDHRVLYYNRAMLDIWGFPPDENLIGVRDVVLQSRIADLIEQPETYIEHIEAVLRTYVVSEPYEVRFRNGHIVTDISAVVEAVQGRRGIGRVWIYEDVTKQRGIERRLVELAEHDPLTGLFNRRRFHEELDRLLAEASRREMQLGLLAIDLDGFKPINDEFGHQAGDAVLVALASAVGDVVRRNELFCRLGGDEFALLVPDTNTSELCELARRVLEVITGLRFEFSGRTVGLSASIGIALYPQHALDGEGLIAVADQAMYASKNAGRGRWTLAEQRADESAPANPIE
ncbi:MAG TPA: diguanylate cyclase [Aromatoleum sp.]|uniref:sensor domain-containing diguanylate cyclase n=1 Tax=Aromatoleum sp. TaxID=2307007 RepID=UPI002B47946B|nr:diguanylate cyclase [Aromatoleum sp.]HJV28467.1 diguanylate cyclase [Aromatoleum sp.]